MITRLCHNKENKLTKEDYSDPEIWAKMPVLLPKKLTEKQVKELYDLIKASHQKFKKKGKHNDSY